MHTIRIVWQINSLTHLAQKCGGFAFGVSNSDIALP